MYDDRKIFCMNLPEFDFGGGAAETLNFRLPSGYQGKLIDMGVMTSEVFAVDSTSASVALGTSSDPDAYAILTIPDATADNDCFDTTDDTDAIISADVAAAALIRVTLTNGTDGSSVTGKGYPFFVFEIFK
jgi:hypothetical protein